VTDVDLVPPSYMSVPPAARDDLGPLAIELAARAGLMLDPWQVFAVERILAERDDRRPAAFEAALIVPRQNGKGSILECLSLAWLFLTDVPLILHSAHEFKTAAEAFRRLRTLITGAPFLARRVARITTAAGNEAIELASGQRLRYVARSKGSGRGFTGGKLILDEAYAIEAEEMAALLPTLATQAEAQLVYTSSAGMAHSSHLRRLRNRGRQGGDPSLCYLEWGGVGECPENCRHARDDDSCALNDRDLWRGANPGLGIRIPEAFVVDERAALTPDAFARERLGWWDDVDIDEVCPITLDEWAGCLDAASAVSGGIVLAVDVTPDNRRASIAVAGNRLDGTPHVELIDARSGVDWVVERLVELRTRHTLRRVTLTDGPHDGVILDPAGPVGGLLQPLKAAGFDAAPMSTRDMGQACAALQAAVRARSVRHIGQDQLGGALAGAIPRSIGDGMWAWGRIRSDRASIDISPLVAVTEALWGLSVAEANPDQGFFVAWR
jgi:phage terminase large subunit-like protein